ncbi:uncharacterized protein [Dysidea avara]|uniref:uncharacterized protein n=1 Tax=Dysidea avara TaxID=196820 RepID=UPI00331D5B4C
MTFSSLLFTEMCCILLMERVHGGIDLSSPHTTAAQAAAAYKISNSEASSIYNTNVKEERGINTYCSRGPVKKVYSTPGFFYWPAIRIRKCDGLICRPGYCVASTKRVLSQWTNVESVHGGIYLNSACTTAAQVSSLQEKQESGIMAS